MEPDRTVILERDVEAAVIPVGTRVTLHAGEEARITQSLGGSYTVVVNGNMFRIEGRDADALGIKDRTTEANTPKPPLPPPLKSSEEVEKLVWEALRTCYDPEIPVNIVDLGLVYTCEVHPVAGGSGYRVEVKMTLTAPGCGMGPMIQQDAHDKILAVAGIESVNVELVWEPQWNQGMISEAAKLELGLM